MVSSKNSSVLLFSLLFLYGAAIPVDKAEPSASETEPENAGHLLQRRQSDYYSQGFQPQQFAVQQQQANQQYMAQPQQPMQQDQHQYAMTQPQQPMQQDQHQYAMTQPQQPQDQQYNANQNYLVQMSEDPAFDQKAYGAADSRNQQQFAGQPSQFVAPAQQSAPAQQFTQFPAAAAQIPQPQFVAQPTTPIQQYPQYSIVDRQVNSQHLPNQQFVQYAPERPAQQPIPNQQFVQYTPERPAQQQYVQYTPERPAQQYVQYATERPAVYPQHTVQKPIYTAYTQTSYHPISPPPPPAPIVLPPKVLSASSVPDYTRFLLNQQAAMQTKPNVPIYAVIQSPKKQETTTTPAPQTTTTTQAPTEKPATKTTEALLSTNPPKTNSASAICKQILDQLTELIDFLKSNTKLGSNETQLPKSQRGMTSEKPDAEKPIASPENGPVAQSVSEESIDEESELE